MSTRLSLVLAGFLIVAYSAAIALFLTLMLLSFLEPPVARRSAGMTTVVKAAPRVHR